MIDERRFAARFVREYWEDVVRHPGHEPVEETVDELVADVEYQVEERPRVDEFGLNMLGSHGDTWTFTFRVDGDEIRVTELTANDSDLLDETYRDDFQPMMDRVLAACRSPQEPS